MSTAIDAAQREAVAAWLADSLNKPSNARQQWADGHVAVLALGRRFSAVRLAEELVYALALHDDNDFVVTTTVLHMLNGPVIHDPCGRRFYALVPPASPGPSLGPYATFLGFSHYVGVPRVGDTEPEGPHASYWAVPMRTPGALCDPVRVYSMIMTGTGLLNHGEVADS
ncbi:hypothetical protein [Streptomyces sp. NPDC051994]|uniref:hypothetical protein n=1 Tax=unclassified Streptomyces TaxID=2593676 RepID=UPI00342F99D0